MTALDALLSGGARVLPVVVASLAGCFVIIERLLVIRMLRRDSFRFMRELRALKDRAAHAGLQDFLANAGGRAAAVFGHGVGRSDPNAEDVARLTEAAWADEVDRLERPLAIGAVASVVAFLSGLLPFFLDLLALLPEGGGSSSGLHLPGVSSIISAIAGCSVAGVLFLGLFVTQQELHRLLATVRSLVPEFVRLLRTFSRDVVGPIERPGRFARSPAAMGEDEFFRPRVAARAGYGGRSE